MIDNDGYRPNVGIILANEQGKLFWARRIGQDAWQFPQGGINDSETPEQAMYRELYEEIGLYPEHVEIIACTKDWLRYKLPKRYIRWNSHPVCMGQKQIWYMLRFKGNETDFRFDCYDAPEFDQWKWLSYWEPAEKVVYFKRDVYKKALKELQHHLIVEK